MRSLGVTPYSLFSLGSEGYNQLIRINYQSAMDLRFALENETVDDVGFSPPATVQKHETVQSAIEFMRRNRYGCILVLDGEKFCGIFKRLITI